MIIKKYKIFLEKKQQDLWLTIPESVKDLNKAFKKAGKSLYIVGGSIRDFITDSESKDIDLATDALPEEVIKILKFNNYNFGIQGKAFGVVVVYTDDQTGGMEIATFREDLTTGRKPGVKLGVTIEDDVKRRDLTYNALFYDIDKREIIDLTGGKDDLERGITRMVGDPLQRFEEDSLRILRAFRFASRYGHKIHNQTGEAIKKRNQLENIDPDSGKMIRISQERIWDEIEKAWKQAIDFNQYLELFNEYDMWDQVFPNSNINKEFVDSNDFIVVLANLFKNENVSKLERKLVQSYKIDTSKVKKIIFLISLLSFDSNKVFDFYKSKTQSGIEDSSIKEWSSVQKLDNDLIYKFINYKPSVSAEELMKRGFKGPELGREIKRLETEKFKKGI